MHEVKNIREPVKAYRVLMVPEFEGKLIGFEKKTSKTRWMGVAATVVFIVIGLIIYQVYQSKQILPVKEARAEGPSIAVLTFDNMSTDPDHKYFGDGISEDLITDLSKIHDLLVISRLSSFTYVSTHILMVFYRSKEHYGSRGYETWTHKDGDKVIWELLDTPAGASSSPARLMGGTGKYLGWQGTMEITVPFPKSFILCSLFKIDGFV